MIDVSASMEGRKLDQVKAATMAAVGCITDGVRFGIIAGNEQAAQVFPTVGLVPATDRTRGQAARAITKLKAGGGTAIGEWVSLAARLHARVQGVRHSILRTDGRDEHETPEALDAALELARGNFQCDCRGVGTDWSVRELRQVADALLGTVDIVADPTALSDDFELAMREAMRRAVPDVRLRVRIEQFGELLSVKQAAPTLNDLTPSLQIDDYTADFALGAWAEECRDYEIGISLHPGEVGDRRTVAEIGVIVSGEQVADDVLVAAWSDDPLLWGQESRMVAYYTAQQDLADAIQSGLASLKRGDSDAARVTLGTAVRLAHASGNSDAAYLLGKVVDVEDWPTGKVRLKERISRIDEMTLETRSTRTGRVPR